LFASLSSADSDSDDSSSTTYGHNRSSSSSSRRSISADYVQQLQQQPQHPRSFLLKGDKIKRAQQEERALKEQQLMQANRSMRTVQWYREQANRRLTHRIMQAPDLAGLRQLMRQYEGEGSV
jgi:hypothetical protein